MVKCTINIFNKPRISQYESQIPYREIIFPFSERIFDGNSNKKENTCDLFQHLNSQHTLRGNFFGAGLIPLFTCPQTP